MYNIKLLAAAIYYQAVKDARNKKVSRAIHNDAVHFLNSDYGKDILEFITSNIKEVV